MNNINNNINDINDINDDIDNQVNILLTPIFNEFK